MAPPHNKHTTHAKGNAPLIASSRLTLSILTPRGVRQTLPHTLAHTHTLARKATDKTERQQDSVQQRNQRRAVGHVYTTLASAPDASDGSHQRSERERGVAGSVR